MEKNTKLGGSYYFGKIIGQHSRPQFPLPPLGSLTSWRMERPGGEKWEHLRSRGNNGKLPLRICPEYSVQETHKSPD